MADISQQSFRTAAWSRRPSPPPTTCRKGHCRGSAHKPSPGMRPTTPRQPRNMRCRLEGRKAASSAPPNHTKWPPKVMAHRADPAAASEASAIAAPQVSLATAAPQVSPATAAPRVPAATAAPHSLLPQLDTMFQPLEHASSASALIPAGARSCRSEFAC